MKSLLPCLFIGKVDVCTVLLILGSWVRAPALSLPPNPGFSRSILEKPGFFHAPIGQLASPRNGILSHLVAWALKITEIDSQSCNAGRAASTQAVFRVRPSVLLCSGHYALLPFVEQTALYQQFEAIKDVNSPHWCGGI